MELLPPFVGSLSFNVISGRLLIILIARHRAAIYIFPIEEKRNERRRGESVKRREKGKSPSFPRNYLSLSFSCLLNLHSRRVSVDEK